MEIAVKNINRILKKLKLPRSRAATLIGVDQSYLQKMLTGKRPLRLEVVVQIADLVGVPVTDLLRAREGELPVTLGPLEIPVVDPRILLTYSRGEPLTMDQIKDVISIPNIKSIIGNCPKNLVPGRLLALEIEECCGCLFVIDPEDREPTESGRFLCCHGRHDIREHRFSVGRLLPHSSGKLTLYDHTGNDPKPRILPREQILGRVIWRIECCP